MSFISVSTPFSPSNPPHTLSIRRSSFLSTHDHNNRLQTRPAVSAPKVPKSTNTTTTMMAAVGGERQRQRQRQRRAENVAGDFFVDGTCIDCDTCRWFCPSVFNRQNGQSAVYAQPQGDVEETGARQAAVACPTGSIRVERGRRFRSRGANSPLSSFPKLHSPSLLPGVFYNGHTSRDTFGASSWLLVPPTGGAVMVDCPRYSDGLAARIEAACGPGGVEYLVLTHSDDVAGHAQWAARLGAKRVIHTAEVSHNQGTDKCEMQLCDEDFHKVPLIEKKGEQSNDERKDKEEKGDGTTVSEGNITGLQLTDEVFLMHTPGHTRGSIVVWYPRGQALFTGDHCFGTALTETLPDKGIAVSQAFCFYDLDTQLDQVRRLAALPVRHILPGHGRPVTFESVEQARKALQNVGTRVRTL